MRKHDEVTEAELKKAYDENPAFNQYVPWAEVLKAENQIFKTLLINQIIAHEQEEPVMQKQNDNKVIFLADERRKVQPKTAGRAPAPAPEGKKAEPKTKITLCGRQIEKLKSALVLSRNCLKYGGMSDAVRNEALDSIAEGQKIIDGLTVPRA